jgi:hypothetical protein
VHREGRCALNTSFIIFKFMILNAVIQLIQTARLFKGTP